MKTSLPTHDDRDGPPSPGGSDQVSFVRSRPNAWRRWFAAAGGMLRSAGWAVAVSAGAAACGQQVVINELVSSNGSVLADEDGDFSDWLEILNRGAETVDLAGWGLSDRPGEPFRWVFPSVTLAPGERTLVWASGKDRPGGSAPLQPQSPDTVAGLVVWLKADASGLSNGQRVATWNDASGRGNHAVQPTSNRRPTYVTNVVNGLPVIRFNRSQNHFLQLPTAAFSGMEDLANFTLLAMARWNGAATAGIFGTYGGSGNDGNCHFEITTTGGNLRLRVAANSGLQVANAVSSGNWQLFGATMHTATDSPQARLFLNGNPLGSSPGDPGDAFLTNYERVMVGSSYDQSRAFDGDIAELVMYNRPLDAAALAAVQVHLNVKYGLADPPPTTLYPHANFSIAAEGETLTLTRPDGSTADVVPTVAVPRDAAYGRGPDGAESFGWLLPPTPLAANAAMLYGPQVARPSFSHPRGYYDEPFALAINHPDPEATIHYTLDGGVPDAGSPVYSQPLEISATTVVRAAASKPGALPLPLVATYSYLFPADIAGQTGTPDGYPATWGSFSQVSYGMSPAAVAAPGHAAALRSALAALPAVSLVLPVEDMFGANGVYANPTVRGLERATSAEWLHPAGDLRADFQIDCGLRVQGGASRVFANSPKKSLRLLFKGDYGETRLRQPVFAAQGLPLADFNSLVLRAEYNNSWIHWDAGQRLRALYARDQWVRDSQIAAGGPGAYGNHVHLFVNGRYWGLYNPAERADAAYAAGRFGGEPEDYDAMTHRGLRDGNRLAWDEMFALARAGLTDNANYLALADMLDIDGFADYMIVNHYGGNWDWPGNNWNAVRKRAPGERWHFVAWDAERTLESATDNRVNAAGDNGPGELFSRLRANAEFRLRFADRVRRHCFDGGILTPAAAAGRLQPLLDRVEQALYGEEARWGAYRSEIYDRNGPSPRYQRDPHWLAERQRLFTGYFPVRTDNLVAQYQAIGLYPATAAPQFGRHGGELPDGEPVTITAAAGDVYFTLDGSDPREFGTGAVAAAAVIYTEPFPLGAPTTVKARALHNGAWSALLEAEFFPASSVPEFLPGGTADWTLDANWTSPRYPDGPGARARVFAPAAADRSIELRAPVTVGELFFDMAASPWRNRLRDRGTGNSLTFDRDGSPAMLRVTGEGAGFVEFEFTSECVLADDLVLEVDNLSGDPEHGALRLRTRWSGPGGLIKTGPGTASLTGEDKVFTGAATIRQGVLQVTGPAAMAAGAGVTVEPGGQLRLISAGTAAEPRQYAFGGTLQLAGDGRLGLPEDSGFGILGALRYAPGVQDSVAVLTSPLALAAAAGIHVDGSRNRLELAGPLAGDHPLTKSGGGLLRVTGDHGGWLAPVTVANGTLELAGHIGGTVTVGEGATIAGFGRCGALDGTGWVMLDRTLLRGATLDGPLCQMVFSTAGPPDFSNPAACGNGVLVTDGRAVPRGLALYLDHPAPRPGDRWQGGILMPVGADWFPVLIDAAPAVLVPDENGTHLFAGRAWSPLASGHVTRAAITADFGDGPQPAEILEVRIGGGATRFGDWQTEAFPDPADLADPLVSGPAAAPFGDGVANLVRYALGGEAGASAAELLPRVVDSPGGRMLRFPFDPGRFDVRVRVQGTDHPADWSNADILFDSVAVLSPTADGWVEVPLPERADGRYFVRLSVELP